MPLPFLKFFVSIDEKNGCRTSNNQIALNTLARSGGWAAVRVGFGDAETIDCETGRTVYMAGAE